MVDSRLTYMEPWVIKDQEHHRYVKDINMRGKVIWTDKRLEAAGWTYEHQVAWWIARCTRESSEDRDLLAILPNYIVKEPIDEKKKQHKKGGLAPLP